MRHWTDKEDEALKALLGTGTYADIARQIGRSERAVERRVANLGLARQFPRSRTPVEDREIRLAFNSWRTGNPGAQLSWRV